MIELLKQLVTALRDELQQYGEMLARLDEQQDRVIQRVPAELLASVDAVQGQGVVLRTVRQAREVIQERLARHLNLAPNTSLGQLLQQMPEEYRVLVQALVQENNELLVRVQQRARQNHLLLARSVELMQGLLGSLFPAGSAPVYNGTGHSFARPITSQSLYEAVC